MPRAGVKAAALSAILASSLLGACQTTAAAPVICDVSTSDIESLQSQYREHFEMIMQSIMNLKDVDGKTPRLKKPFERNIAETLTVSADNPDASIGYSWRVDLAKGCTLDARLGTNTKAKSEGAAQLDVKALSFTGEKLPDGTTRFSPLKIIIKK